LSAFVPKGLNDGSQVRSAWNVPSETRPVWERYESVAHGSLYSPVLILLVPENNAPQSNSRAANHHTYLKARSTLFPEQAEQENNHKHSQPGEPGRYNQFRPMFSEDGEVNLQADRRHGGADQEICRLDELSSSQVEDAMPEGVNRQTSSPSRRLRTRLQGERNPAQMIEGRNRG
jgi:hypothetical protein